VTQLITALVSIHSSMAFLADMYSFLDPPGRTVLFSVDDRRWWCCCMADHQLWRSIEDAHDNNNKPAPMSNTCSCWRYFHTQPFYGHYTSQPVL